jgi:integrase
MPRKTVPFFEERGSIFARLYEYQEIGQRAPVVKLCSIEERDCFPNGKNRTPNQRLEFLEKRLIEAKKKKMLQLEAKRLKKVEQKVESFSWRKCVQLYLDNKNHSEMTQKIVIIAAEHFHDAIGSILIADLRSLHSNIYASHLKNLGLSPNTINSYLRHIRAVLNWACENEMIEKVPKFASVPVPQNQQVEVYNKTDIQKLWLHINDLIENGEPHYRQEYKIHLRAMMMQWGSGCRVGETLFLPLERIDLENGRIEIKAIPGLWSPKGLKEGAYALTRVLVDFLRKDLAEREPAERWYLDNGFGNPRYRKTTTLAHAFKKYQRRLGISHSSWGRGPKANHGFRATAATTMLESGVDTKVVQQVLRHSNINVTERYLRIGNSLHKDAIDKMSDNFLD